MRSSIQKRYYGITLPSSGIHHEQLLREQKQPSLREQYLLRKLYVRMRSANRFQIRMYDVAYYCGHTAAHGQGYFRYQYERLTLRMCCYVILLSLGKAFLTRHVAGTSGRAVVSDSIIPNSNIRRDKLLPEF